MKFSSPVQNLFLGLSMFLLRMRNKWIFSVIQKRERRLMMKPSFLPHWPLLRIKSHVTIITCSDFQRWQLTHDALPFPAFSRRKVILSSDKMLPLLTSSQEHTRMHMKDAFRGGFFSAERVHFQKAKPKSLHLKSMLLKIMAFLSLFSFY